MELDNPKPNVSAQPPAPRATASAEEQTFPVDVEHVGIRVAIPVIMIGSGIILYLLISKWLVPTLTMNRVETDDVNDFLSIVLAAIGGIGLGALADRVLKRVWPSGRTLMLSPNSLRLRNRNGSEITLDLSQRLNPTLWRFRIRRSSPRAQSGWYMLAVQLTQSDDQLTFYTFAPPKVSSQQPSFERFVELLPRLDLEKKTLPLRVVSEQRRLETAEDDRLVDGAELRTADFFALLHALSASVPDWQPPTASPLAKAPLTQ